MIDLKTQYNLVKKLKSILKQDEEIVRYVYKFLKTKLLNIIDEQTVQTNSRHKRETDPFGKNQEKDETTESSPKLYRDIKKDVQKQNYQTLTKIYSLFDVIFLRSYKFRCLVTDELSVTVKPLFEVKDSEFILEMINSRQLTKLRDQVIGVLQIWRLRFSRVHLELETLSDYVKQVGGFEFDDNPFEVKNRGIEAEEDPKSKIRRLTKIKKFSKQGKILLDRARNGSKDDTVNKIVYEELRMIVQSLSLLVNIQNRGKGTSVLKKLIDAKYKVGRNLNKYDTKATPKKSVLKQVPLEDLSDSDSCDDFEEVAEKPEYMTYMVDSYNREQSENKLENKSENKSLKKPSKKSNSGKSEFSKKTTLPNIQDLLQNSLLRPRKHKNIVRSAAKDMDLSNSWHRYDDWNDDENDVSDSDVDSHLDKNGYSLDGSVAFINIPTIETPILHTCRAKMPSGKLCPRQDRKICPLHGEIVERDGAGLEVGFSKRSKEVVRDMFSDDKPVKKKMKMKRTDIRDRITSQLEKDKRKRRK